MAYGPPKPTRRVAGSRQPRAGTPPKQARARKRALVWIGGIATAGVGALVAAIMSGLGSAAVTQVTRSQPHEPSGLPAKIDLVSVVRGPGDTHVAANPLILSADQLDQLNGFNQTDPAYQAWFTAHGAVDVDRTDVQFTVEGNRTDLVRIVGIQPVITCSAPLNGTLFYSPAAGDDRSTQLFVNLDSPHSVPSYIAEDSNGNFSRGSDFFGTYTVSLKQAEQYTFKVVASTAAHYCTFTLDMTVLAGGQTTVEHISDNGQPFRVTAMIDPDSSHPRPGEYSAYSVLYIGGVGNVGGGQNSFGDDLWARADPNSYSP